MSAYPASALAGVHSSTFKQVEASAARVQARGHDWWHRYVWAPAADAPRVRGVARGRRARRRDWPGGHGAPPGRGRARRRVAVERADYRVYLDKTWFDRVERAERAKDAWRRERDSARCGAPTKRNTPCNRPVETDGDRCASRADDPHRCGAVTKADTPCRRPVAAPDERCRTHSADSATAAQPAVQPAVTDDETGAAT